MKRLQDKGVSYFVMDLRDNLGGLVQVHSATVTLDHIISQILYGHFVFHLAFFFFSVLVISGWNRNC